MNMYDWNCNNPNILELKYEEIVSGEVATFDKIFNHYELPSEWRSDWLNLVEIYSYKNRNKRESNKSHTRDGSARQWEKCFSDNVKNEFKEKYGNLLI